MKLTERLAALCVSNRLTKCAADEHSLPQLRDQFEHLKGHEEVMRRHAARLKALAEDRAVDEDTSLTGYGQTAVERLTPVPQTLTEAAIRLPLIGLGGHVGYNYAKKHWDPLAEEDIGRVINPAKDESMLGKHLQEKLLAQGKPDVSADILKALKGADSGAISGATRHSLWRSPAAKQLRETLGGNADLVRSELQNLAKQTAGKDALGTVSKALSPHRLTGGLLGLGAGSIATGLPFALRALYLKSHGGEAAYQARSDMEAAIRDADNLATRREDVLQHLPKTACLAPYAGVKA